MTLIPNCSRCYVVVLSLLPVLALSISVSAQTEKKPEAPAVETKPAADPVPAPITGMTPVTTPSGLKYYEFQPGTGEQPTPGSTITVHYSGWLTDGKLFDSSVKRGTPSTYKIDEMIQGWKEGVGSMKVGGKRRLEIPYALAYGDRGRPPRIPEKADLVFEVELLGVTQPPKQTSVEGITPVTTPSGLKYWEIKVGDGPTPSATSTVTVHYAGWLTDGLLFDTSIGKNPMTIAATQLSKGFAEGVTTMKVGGKRRLEVHPAIGYGERGFPPHIGPNATLIFEVELLGIK